MLKIRTIFFALTFLKIFKYVITDGAEAETAVVTLTKSNFDSFIKENELTLVEFFAPWCGHCQRLKPEYEKAAVGLKEDGILLGAVDATAESDLATRYEIKSYPTLLLFRKGLPEPYKGGRTSDSIIQWIKSKTGPTLLIVESLEKAKAEAKDQPVVFIAQLKSKKSPTYSMVENVTTEMSSFGKFIAVVHDSGDDTMHALREQEGSTHTIKLKDADTIKKFVDLERFPLFGPINAANYEDYFKSDRDMVWFIGSEEDYKSTGTIMRTSAAAFREKVNCVWLNTAEFKEHAEANLGITKFPGLIYQGKEFRYLYPDEKIDSSKSVSDFIQNVIDGKIERHLISEPIPEPTDDPVKVVVGKTITTVGMQPDKDVFLEVYAPWCGHCKQFESVYKEFAENMKPYSHIVVAKLDGTKNESPSKAFSWSGYPTVFFTKAGSDTPLVYDGPRTVDGLTDYLKQHGSKPLKEETEQEKKDEL